MHHSQLHNAYAIYYTLYTATYTCTLHCCSFLVEELLRKRTAAATEEQDKERLAIHLKKLIEATPGCVFVCCCILTLIHVSSSVL
jgi:hypothetical protein